MSQLPSPCCGVCTLHNGYCLGCARTTTEIERWSRMSDAEKREALIRIGELKDETSTR